MKKLTLMSVVAVLCLQMNAQQPPDIKPLNIGDTVPDIVLTNVYNYPDSVIRLSDLRGKLVILDFWSSWCASCIALFPHLDLLQREFDENIQFVLVNTKSKIFNDDKSKIKEVLDRVKSRTGIALNMPVVYNSEKLDGYFPCITIPHEVWIDKDGRVIGITSAEEVNAVNIKKILAEKGIRMRLKRDRFDIDLQRPLFVNGNGGDGSETIYRSIVTSYIDGINGRSGILYQNNEATGLYLFNQPLASITEMIYAKEISGYKIFHSSQIIMEVKDKKKFDAKKSDSAYYQNLFSYELRVPPTDESVIFEFARQDLKRYFNISVKHEVRNMRCLVLRSGNAVGVMKNSNDMNKGYNLERASLKKYIHGYPPHYITRLLNSYTEIPLIDETNITGNISVDFPFFLNDLDGLAGSFRRAGLILDEEYRMLEVIVITDK